MNSKTALGPLQTSFPIPFREAPVKDDKPTYYSDEPGGSMKFERRSLAHSTRHAGLGCQKLPLVPTESCQFKHLGRSSRVTKYPTKSKPLKAKKGAHGRGRPQRYDCYGLDGENGPTTQLCREEPTDIFACHFFKLNPAQNIKCMTLKLTRIRDIRQHILRQHTCLYCPTCHEKFSSRSQRDDHIYARLCSPRPLSSMDKLDMALQKLADHRVDRTLSTHDQWYEIWDGLFPTALRPDNPYLGSMVEETVCLIRDHWTRERSRLLPAFCSTKAKANEENFGELLVYVFNDFYTQIDQGTPESSREPSPTNEVVGQGEALSGLNNPEPPSNPTSNLQTMVFDDISSPQNSSYPEQSEALPWVGTWDSAATTVLAAGQCLTQANGNYGLEFPLSTDSLSQSNQYSHEAETLRNLCFSQFGLFQYPDEQYPQDIELGDNNNSSIKLL